MTVTPTSIPDVLVLDPKVLEDERGFFFESYSERVFQKLGLPTRFVQDNHSRSIRGVLRGIHYQIERSQAKLVRVLVGEVYDVAVDLRRSSPTFGRWVGEFLSESNHRMLWVPPGFGHGFLVLSDVAEFAYKASEFYAPEHERTILWEDPGLAIDWPLHLIREEAPVLSMKDMQGRLLREAELFS